MTDAKQMLIEIYEDLTDVCECSSHAELSYVVGRIAGKIDVWQINAIEAELRAAVDLPSSLVVEPCVDCGGFPMFKAEDNPQVWWYHHECSEGDFSSSARTTYQEVVELWNARLPTTLIDTKLQEKDEPDPEPVNADPYLCGHCRLSPTVHLTDLGRFRVDHECIHRTRLTYFGVTRDSAVNKWNKAHPEDRV